MWINEMTQVSKYPKPGNPSKPLLEIFNTDNVLRNNIDSFTEALCYAMNKLTKHKTKLYGMTHFNLNVSIDIDATISFFKDNGESVDGLLSAMHETNMFYLSLVYAVRKTGGKKYNQVFFVDEDFFGDLEYALHGQVKKFIEEINTL